MCCGKWQASQRKSAAKTERFAKSERVAPRGITKIVEQKRLYSSSTAKFA
jgi:hypothetical protein